jgi:hypothetical protein
MTRAVLEVLTLALVVGCGWLIVVALILAGLWLAGVIA